MPGGSRSSSAWPRVPSAERTGLKIHLMNVTVGDGEAATVTLELARDSIGSLLYDANGFQLSPVLHVK